MNEASCNIQLVFVYDVKYDKFSKRGGIYYEEI